MNEKDWLCGHISGIGDCLFEVVSREADAFSIRNLLRLIRVQDRRGEEKVIPVLWSPVQIGALLQSQPLLLPIEKLGPYGKASAAAIRIAEESLGLGAGLTQPHDAKAILDSIKKQAAEKG
jgi:hypothetical protein